MFQNLLQQYKYPLFLSLIFTIISLALRLESHLLNAIYFLVGAFFGTFFLDLDYFLFAYITEPDHYFSKELKKLIGRKNIPDIVSYVDTHKAEMGDSVLHSALFQGILVILSFYVVSSTGNIFMKALVMTAMLQSFYRQFKEYEKKGNLDDWFWMLTEKPHKNFLTWYFAIIGFIFLYSFLILI